VFAKFFTYLHLHYIYLADGEFNFWMLAMIGIGSAFIVFVLVSIYLMWYEIEHNFIKIT